MGALNKVMLIGNLGRDPEIRHTPSGSQVANFTMATTERYTDKSGNRQERTEWHKVVLFGKIAEIAGQYLSKGRQVYIEGRLQTREWEDKSGQRRWTTEVVGNNLVMLGRGDGSGGGHQSEGGYQAEGGAGGYENANAPATASLAKDQQGGSGGFRPDSSLDPVNEDDDLPF